MNGDDIKEHKLVPSALEGELLQETYLIEELIGEGGMAWVYRAVHQKLKHPVAIKVLRQERSEKGHRTERFLREAKILYSLQHPNIVRVLEFLDDRGMVGFVQELCTAGDLRDYLFHIKRPCTVSEIQALFLPLLDAIQLAHEQGIIHRDIKSQNILLQHQNGKLTPKLTDFGLAKELGADTLTKTGSIMGTMQYMPPEQFEETKKVDLRADLYSFGILLYEMATGRLPYTAKMPKLIFQIINNKPPAPTEAPAAMQSVIQKAIAGDPGERYQTAEEMSQAIQDVLGIQTKSSSSTDTLADWGSFAGSSFASFASEINLAQLDASGSAGIDTEDRVTDTAPGALAKRAPDVRELHSTHTALQPGATNDSGLRIGWWILALLFGASWAVWSSTQTTPAPPELRQVMTVVAKPAKGIIPAKNLFERGHQLATSGKYKQARVLLEGACQARHSQGCYILAIMLKEGKGGTVDIPRFKSLIMTSCSSGVKVACIDLSKFYILKDQFQLAAAPLKKGCKHKDAWSCFYLALFRLRGRIKPKKMPLIMADMKRACDMYYMSACAWMGKIHANKSSKAYFDRKKAAGYFRKACRLGWAEGCAMAAILPLYASKSLKDCKKLNPLLKRACRLGYKRVCNRTCEAMHPISHRKK